MLPSLGQSERYRPRTGGSARHPSDVVDRLGHAQALLRALDHLPNPTTRGVPGIYLEVQGRPGEYMATESLNKSDLTLLRVRSGQADFQQRSSATVFATAQGLEKLRRKIAAFSRGNRLAPDGTERPPANADLVQSIGSIVEAGLLALWKSPVEKFPTAVDEVMWELWLDNSMSEEFIERASGYRVILGGERLEFPEDVVVLASARKSDLALAVRSLGAVRALALPSTTAEVFDGMDVDEQVGWVQSLTERTTFPTQADPSYVTLLDSGISRSHPLVAPALAVEDRHAARPEWTIEDNNGHGTKIAGLALYGDLTLALQGLGQLTISHRLESVKVIPDAAGNPYHLLGAVTKYAVDVVEVQATRRRAFTLATTTEDDTPHDGAPTSWSTEVDQLTSGASGMQECKRLFLLSAGNSDQNNFGNSDYLSVSDDVANEIESPAQSWNAVCVGAFTEKVLIPPGEAGAPFAPFGDLSPSSRTASWSSHWALKPDIVMEGGNWVVHGMPPPLKHPALSLLTTSHHYPLRSFTTCGETSGATALAAKAIVDLWSDYPALWPETIRALLVSSARWTPQMLSHLPPNPGKGHYAQLFKRYGYGVPDMERARRSASNALTLIVQDEIIPYRKSATASADHVHNEMRLFEIPWPVQALRQLGSIPVKLRISLSTFVFPNPAEAARGSKFRYASHNLRFKLNRANEDRSSFLARISAAAEQTDGPLMEESDGWTFGRNRRDVGSLHIDEMIIGASDLARRNLVAVHPVAGWWKIRKLVEAPETKAARFALIIEIDAPDVSVDLYAEVKTAVENLGLVEILSS